MAVVSATPTRGSQRVRTDTDNLEPPQKRRKTVNESVSQGLEAREPRFKCQKKDALISDNFNSNHAELLSFKMLSYKELNKLAESHGLTWKSGKFTNTEQELVHQALQTYRRENGLSEQELQDCMFPKSRSRDGSSRKFWSEITSKVPGRPFTAVFHYARRHYHPLRGQGKWTEEESELLRTAYLRHGPQWETISDIVGRSGGDCRDRYRGQIMDADTRKRGKWTKEEEERLTEIVTDMTIKQGKDMNKDVFWSAVSAQMGDTRTRQQCSFKWLDTLSGRVATGGEARWTKLDSFILVHKVASLNVVDDSEIDWRQLPDDDWNFFSAHEIQRYWKKTKDAVSGSDQMTHTEIMEHVLAQNSELPDEGTKNISRSIKSATIISDSSDESEDEIIKSLQRLSPAHSSSSDSSSASVVVGFARLIELNVPASSLIHLSSLREEEPEALEISEPVFS